MTSDEIRALFDGVRGAYARFDPAALRPFYADDCIVESPIGGTVQGRDGVERIARLTFEAFPDFTIEPGEFLIADGRVILTLTIHGTDTGGLFGFPPTGKRIRVPSVFLFTVAGGRIVHERRTYDFSGFLMQLTGDTAPASASAHLYREILDRAQLERDVRVAAEIQRALLPARRRQLGAIDIAALSIPCRAIGGDFFDYFERADGATGLVIGDVSGKGAPAALLTAVLQGILSVHAYGDDAPGATVQRVNEALARRSIAARFATMFYGVVWPDGRMRYCNAGHNPPIVLGTTPSRRLEIGGTIVGAFADARFEEAALQLTRGDTLFAFSDGLTEAVNREGEEFGDARLIDGVRAAAALDPAAMLDRTFECVRRFTGDAAQNDDMTALAVRWAG